MNLTLDRSAWRKVKLGDVALNVNDYFDSSRDGELPYVAGPHIDSTSALVSEWGMTSDDDFPPTFKRLFHPGDVLLHSRGVEKIAVVQRRGVTGEKLFVLRSRDLEVLDQRFLVWLLRSPAALRYFQANFSGSVNKFLNWRPLEAFQFELPPVDQQRQIAELMWAVEHEAGAVRATERAVEVVESTILRSLWSRGFETCRLDSMVASSLGGVWGVEPGLADSDVSVIRGTDIGLDGEVDFGRAPLRGVTTSELAKRRLQPGDVVLEKSGGSPDQPVGKCAVVGEPPGLAVASNFVVVLRARSEVASGAYLAAVLRGMRVTGRMGQFVGKTTGISNLRTKELLSAQVPCPSLREQGDFLRSVERVKATRARVAEEAARLASLKENLLSEAFR